jgi:hypothetical protein
LDITEEENGEVDESSHMFVSGKKKKKSNLAGPRLGGKAAERK